MRGYRTDRKTLRNKDREMDRGYIEGETRKQWGTRNTGKNFKIGTGRKIQGETERKFKR